MHLPAEQCCLQSARVHSVLSSTITVLFSREICVCMYVCMYTHTYIYIYVSRHAKSASGDPECRISERVVETSRGVWEPSPAGRLASSHGGRVVWQPSRQVDNTGEGGQGLHPRRSPVLPVPLPPHHPSLSIHPPSVLPHLTYPRCLYTAEVTWCRMCYVLFLTVSLK